MYILCDTVVHSQLSCRPDWWRLLDLAAAPFPLRATFLLCEVDQLTVTDQLHVRRLQLRDRVDHAHVRAEAEVDVDHAARWDFVDGHAGGCGVGAPVLVSHLSQAKARKVQLL